MIHKLDNIEKLDEEFKIRLQEIQPYVNAIRWTNCEIQLCQKWLHKLLKTDRREKSLRNDYLAKLVTQIKNGELNEPFNKFPQDNESLLPLATYLPTNLNVSCDEIGSTQVHTFVSDTLSIPITTVVVRSKCIENLDISNEHTMKEIKINEDFNEIKMLPNTNDISDTALQSHEIALKNNKESGDGLILNYKTQIKLELIEKMYKELKIKNEFLVDQVQLYLDRKKFKNDHISIINADLDKVKKEMNKMRNRVNNVYKWKVTKKLEDLKNCKIILDKTTTIDSRMEEVILEVKKLKTGVEIACENRKMMNDLRELLKYMKEQYDVYITENQQNFIDKINKLQNEMDQLKAYANIKTKEAQTLEEIVNNQNLSINSYKKSVERVEEFLTEKNINID